MILNEKQCDPYIFGDTVDGLVTIEKLDSSIYGRVDDVKLHFEQLFGLEAVCLGDDRDHIHDCLQAFQNVEI